MTAREQAMHWIGWLASPRWSVAFFLLTGVGALAVLYGWAGGTVAMLVPLGLLAVNLLASIVTHRRFRADTPLLLFHLALLALVSLFVAARLTYLEGVVTLRKGETFTGRLQAMEHGPWHDLSRLAAVRFESLGFTDTFREEGRFTTRNRVRLQGEAEMTEAEIGLDRPLVAGHYRIYTSSNRGLAAIFEWRPDSGASQHGAVHFSVQRDGFTSGASWQLPNGQEAWATLDIAELPPRTAGTEVTDLWAGKLPHTLVLRLGSERHVLASGDSLALSGGQLIYRDLEPWMGYRVLYDPTRPWLMATIAIAVGSLIWFYVRTVFFRSRRN